MASISSGEIICSPRSSKARKRGVQTTPWLGVRRQNTVTCAGTPTLSAGCGENPSAEGLDLPEVNVLAGFMIQVLAIIRVSINVRSVYRLDCTVGKCYLIGAESRLKHESNVKKPSTHHIVIELHIDAP